MHFPTARQKKEEEDAVLLMKKMGVSSASNRRLRMTEEISVKDYVKGSPWIDCLEHKWRKGEMLGILSGPGVGKCLAKDTKILMFDGSIKLSQDIEIGDELMGQDSKIRTVTSLVQNREEMFEIQGTDKTSYTVNKSHVLSLKYNNVKSSTNYKKGDTVNITVEDYLKLSKSVKTNLKGYRIGVEFPEKETTLDPYLMGVWLGDGTKNRTQITNMEPEIKNYLIKYLVEDQGYRMNNVAKNSDRVCPQYDFNREGDNEFKREIQKFVTEDNQKFIPNNYLINSEENRLRLLAGIVDTDGYLIHNCYEVVIKDQKFADNFEFLVRSLGLKLTRRVKTATIKSIGFSGDYHRFFISGNIDKIPCKVARRIAAPRKQIKDALCYGIKVESKGEGEYYGFTLAEESKLFLLGDFVVTHNTTVSLHIMKDILRNNPDSIAIFVSLEMSEDEILDKWFKSTDDEPELSDSLYVIDNYNEDGSCKGMNVHDIKIAVKMLKEALKKDVAVIVCDHLHEINNNGASDYNKVCEELRNMTKEIDTFTIVQSQTTKEKGIGDIPVPRNGCYGTSRFENLMTYIITIFQPLRRIQNECDLPVLGWSYCKIRFKSKNDKVKEEVNYVKIYDFDTEDLIDLTPNQITMFSLHYDRVLELRENEEKKKSYAFDLSTTITGKDGKTVKLTKIVGGGDSSQD